MSSTIMSFNTATPYSSNYERMSGNCTRILAAQMLSNISPPITSSSYVLDNACGPGIVSEQIKLLHPDAKILATDIAPTMIEELQRAIKSKEWSNMNTEILDVRDLSTLKDETFTHVITNLGLPVPGDLDSSPKIVSEMFRVLKIGGVALVSTWAGKKSPQDDNVMLISRRQSLVVSILQRSTRDSSKRKTRLVHGIEARDIARLMAYSTT